MPRFSQRLVGPCDDLTYAARLQLRRSKRDWADQLRTRQCVTTKSVR
jgi:hypothetical protein